MEYNMSKAPIAIGGVIVALALGIAVYNKGYQQASSEYENRIQIIKSQHASHIRELQAKIDQLEQEKK